MSGRLQGFAWRLWAGEAGLAGRLAAVALAPVAGGFRLAAAARNRRYDRRPSTRVEGIRVISVGNLAVGGTGKTPMSAWIVRDLESQGETPALVTRGYGRDELLLHARWNPEVPVFADADRVEATRKAAQAGATVAVIDDGFQHRRLARDLDVVLLAAEDPFPGHLLPWGPYREPARALERADAVIITRRTADAVLALAVADRVAAEYPHLAVALVHLAPGAWHDLDGRAAEAPAGPVVVATGIARPGAFAANVETVLGASVQLESYADHHEFTRDEVTSLISLAAGRTLVVTEKDAVKLATFRQLLPGARVLMQSVGWEDGEDLIRRLVSGRAGGLSS